MRSQFCGWGCEGACLSSAHIPAVGWEAQPGSGGQRVWDTRGQEWHGMSSNKIVFWTWAVLEPVTEAWKNVTNTELKWLVQKEWLDEAPWAGVERDSSAWEEGELMQEPRGDPRQPLEQGDSPGEFCMAPCGSWLVWCAGRGSAADEQAQTAVICVCVTVLRPTAEGLNVHSTVTHHVCGDLGACFFPRACQRSGLPKPRGQ